MRTYKTLQAKAKAAIKEAVRDVIIHHKHTGRPLAIWQDGKVKWISAERLLRKSKT